MYSTYSLETRVPRTRAHFLIELSSVSEFNITTGQGGILGTLPDGTDVYLPMKCWSSHIEGVNHQRINLLRAIESYYTKKPVQVWVTMNGYLSDVYS